MIVDRGKEISPIINRELTSIPITFQMTKEELAALTDQEVLGKAKKMKSNAIISAVLVGVMVGVIIFSIWKNTVGLFTLIPLIFAFKLINNSKDDKALKDHLKERNLM